MIAQPDRATACNDPIVHYTLPPGIGIWQPNPGTTDMVAPGSGSLRRLMVDAALVRIDGPDPLEQRGVRRRLQPGEAHRPRRTLPLTDRTRGGDRHGAVLQRELRDDGRRRADPPAGGTSRWA